MTIKLRIFYHEIIENHTQSAIPENAANGLRLPTFPHHPQSTCPSIIPEAINNAKSTTLPSVPADIRKAPPRFQKMPPMGFGFRHFHTHPQSTCPSIIPEAINNAKSTTLPSVPADIRKAPPPKNETSLIEFDSRLKLCLRFCSLLMEAVSMNSTLLDFRILVFYSVLSGRFSSMFLKFSGKMEHVFPAATFGNLLDRHFLI